MSVGVDHDTAAFAVNSIRQWWLNLGRSRYPRATRLLITADGGGSNGSRVRLWKRELQKLASADQARRAYLLWGFREIGSRVFEKPVRPGLSNMVVMSKEVREP